MATSAYDQLRTSVDSVVYSDWGQPWLGTVSAYVVSLAAVQFGNSALILTEEREQKITHLRTVARSLFVFDTLVEYGACTPGLKRVGIVAKDWIHLGTCIARLSNTIGEEYLEWCQEILPGHFVAEIERGYDKELPYHYEEPERFDD